MRYIPLLALVPAVALPLCAQATAEHHTHHHDAAHYKWEVRRLTTELDDLRARVAVQEATLSATQRPQNARAQGAATVYTYLPNSIYRVYAAPENTTDLELDPGETITGVQGGDTVRWIIGTASSGQGSDKRYHVFLKPIQADLHTSVVITTNRRTYHIVASSAHHWYMPAVKWDYPQETAKALAHQQAALATQQKQVVTPEPVAPSNLDFAYRISGHDYPWKPLRVFDDGSKTYIQFPPKMHATEAPALFVGKADHLQLVNYRVRGDYFVVDRLFTHAVLRVGVHHQVEIHKIRRGHHWWQFAQSSSNDGSGDTLSN